MTDDERFKGWGEQILKIHEHIMDAIVNRRIHNEIGAILQANCSGLQSQSSRLANKDLLGPALYANRQSCGPALNANKPTLVCKRLANPLAGQPSLRMA
jgi:hypothetical protein